MSQGVREMREEDVEGLPGSGQPGQRCRGKRMRGSLGEGRGYRGWNRVREGRAGKWLDR